jgi:hypothetical protein
MKLTLGQFILVIALMLNSIPSQASGFRFWSALRNGQKVVTNYDVLKHIELTLINDEVRKALFRISESDYNRYQQALSQVAQPEFENALKSMSYSSLIESIAMSNIQRGQRREAFTVTTEDYHNAVSEHESTVLKEWLDQRLGIVVARREYARQLKEEFFPHEAHETDDQIYFRWLDEEKYKIKQSLHQREVSRYEQARISRFLPSRLNRPLEIHDLYQDISRLIEQELQGKELNAQEVARIRNNHPELAVITQDIRALGLQGTSLYRINQFHSDKYRESLRLLQNEFNPNLSEARIERLVHYEQMAFELANRHQDAQKLADLSSERLQAFTSGGSHNDFMMARLYNMARLQLELNPDRDSANALVTEKIRRAMNWLVQQNQTGGIFLTENFQSLLYEDAVVKGLREFLDVQAMADGYEKAYLEMAIWVLKFEAKKVAINDRAIIHVTTLPYQSSQTYRRLEGFLNQRDSQNGYEQFLNLVVAPQSYRIQINPTGDQVLSAEEAFEFIRQ